eukprot:s416_g5.t1
MVDYHVYYANKDDVQVGIHFEYSDSPGPLKARQIPRVAQMTHADLRLRPGDSDSHHPLEVQLVSAHASAGQKRGYQYYYYYYYYFYYYFYYYYYYYYFYYYYYYSITTVYYVLSRCIPLSTSRFSGGSAAKRDRAESVIGSTAKSGYDYSGGAAAAIFDSHVARLQERFEEQVPEQASQEQVAHVPRNSVPSKNSKKSCKRDCKQELESEARFRSTGP